MFKFLRENTLFRFLTVGALGSILNLVVFFLLSDISGINPNVASVIAFFVAVTQNYVLNELWSFAGVGERKVSAKRYAIYVSGNLIGLLVNLGLLNLFLLLYPWKFKTVPQAIAIAAATVLNYLWAKIFVFRKNVKTRQSPID